jgi:hypothetical protein
MANFFKEQVQNRIMVNGAPVAWNLLSGNAGYLTVEDSDPLAAALTQLVGKMGVTKISDEELQEKKSLRKYVDSSSSRFAKSAVQPIRPRSPVAKVEAAPAAPVVPLKPEPVLNAPVAAPKIGRLKPVAPTLT